jgi:hypothetical protein
VEKQETVREGRRPERTVYAITEAGRAEFQDWLAELVSTPVREYTSLEAGLSLIAGISPDEAAELLEQRAVRLKIEIGASDAALGVAAEQGVPDLFVVETRYRKALLEAELAFTSDLARRIRTDDLGGTVWWRQVHELLDQGVSLQEILSDPVTYLGEEALTVAPFLRSGS